MDVSGKTVVLGVTGGIAAYKACDLVSRLRKKNIEVRVIMTEHACEFVRPLTFEVLSNARVVTDQFNRVGGRAHCAGKGGGCVRGRSGDGEFPRQGRKRHRGRHAVHDRTCDPRAAGDRTGDEHRDV